MRERLDLLRERGFVSEEDWPSLASGAHTLSRESADRMGENIIGVFGLPLGVGLNFVINGRDYVVPLVVEEPSIVAALSSAAWLARRAGGFTCEADEALLIGQIQVVEVPHPARAQALVLQHKSDLLNLANSLHPRMVARGGGARDVEVVLHSGSSRHGDMLVVHVLVDTRDAMGANLVNTMCEGVAPLIESLTGGKVFLRILSNLTDRALVKARVELPAELLGGKGYAGGEVRDGIILANELAAVDPYRAATHNKGIMNGVDAVALATGNDWRAIEAAAHAYAARGQRYTALTKWFESDDGKLVGVLEMPMKVGIVGGSLQSNPTVGIALRMLGVRSARELAEVMGAVGLAQNLAALRALVTEGIQRGHMMLHARSVASSAGAPPELLPEVVERLIDSGEIKIWKAKEILDTLQGPSRMAGFDQAGVGYGKVILLGEHAVVYGSHAIAAPVPLAIQSKVSSTAGEGVHLLIPRWGVEDRFAPTGEHRNSLHQSIALILDRLGLASYAIRLEVAPHVPRAMGLGGSAALAVSVIRAVSLHFGLGLGDDEVCRLAYECEMVAHGDPSGIDNTLATFGRPMVFRRAEPPFVRELRVPRPIPIVVGMTGVESLTARMVAGVRAAWEHNPSLYERLFREIDVLALEGVKAVETYNLEMLGELMNVCQGLLNALGVSTWELEELIQIARRHGAAGAKLTGGGGGGSMIAVCPDGTRRVVEAMERAGFRAFAIEVG